MEKIWVLAADKVHARLFQAEHITGPLHEVRDMVNPESRLHERELTTDEPGKVFLSGTGSRGDSRGRGSGSYQGTTSDYEERSEKEHQARWFAKDIVGELDKLRMRGELERVHVLAEPGFLGELREQYTKPLQKCVVSEVGKRATERRPEEVREMLPYRM